MNYRWNSRSRQPLSQHFVHLTHVHVCEMHVCVEGWRTDHSTSSWRTPCSSVCMPQTHWIVCFILIALWWNPSAFSHQRCFLCDLCFLWLCFCLLKNRPDHVRCLHGSTAALRDDLRSALCSFDVTLLILWLFSSLCVSREGHSFLAFTTDQTPPLSHLNANTEGFTVLSHKASTAIQNKTLWNAQFRIKQHYTIMQDRCYCNDAAFLTNTVNY